jgi:trigger factor
MSVTRTNIPHSAVRLHGELPASEMVGYFARAYERLAPTVSIKGFRPGAAPKAMVLSHIGIDRYTQEAINLAIIDSYYQAIHREQLVPLHQPAVVIHACGVDEPLVYDATVDVLPVVDPGDYRHVRVRLPSKSVDVSDEEVTTVLTRLRFQAASVTDVERPAQQGDRVEVNFTGSVHGVVRDQLTSQHHPIILGESHLVPGFEEALVGLSKGEEKRFQLTVDREPVTFDVECLAVQSVMLPALTNEFAQTFGHAAVAALRTAIRKGISDEKTDQWRQRCESVVLEALRTSINLDLPTSLVEQETDRRMATLKQRFGVAFNTFLEQRYGGKLSTLRDELRVESEKSVSAGLILGAIAEREQLVPKGGAKTPEEQSTVMRSTLDRLIGFAEGKK